MFKMATLSCITRSGRYSKAFLDHLYHDRWIRRCGSQHGSLRSPDLNLLDYYLCKNMRNFVYNHDVSFIIINHNQGRLLKIFLDVLHRN
jgi:hypothetical protein